MTQNTCMSCPNPIGKDNRSGRCRACSARASNARRRGSDGPTSRELRLIKNPCATIGCDGLVGSRATSTICRTCTSRIVLNTPEVRAKAVAGMKRFLSDPVNRDIHSKASQRRLAAWRKANPEKSAEMGRHGLAIAATAENRAKCRHAQRAAAYPDIPEHRWDEVRRLRKSMPAAEAKAIILADEAAIERRRIAAMTPFERQLERIRNGARIVEKPDLRKADPAFTIGGVAWEGM